MNNTLAIVSGIPWWVYPLLAALIAIGVRALKTRYVPLPVALIAPVAFITWGFFTLQGSGTHGVPLLSFVSSAIIGLFIALGTTWNRELVVDRTSRRVCLPGSYVPLIRNLSIFSAKFLLTFTIALRPDLRETLLPWDLGVSGISAGYFLGWSTWIVTEFFKRTKSNSSQMRASDLQDAREPHP